MSVIWQVSRYIHITDTMLSMLYCKQTYTMHWTYMDSLQTTPKISQELAATGSTLWFRQQRSGGRQHSRPPGEPSSKGAAVWNWGMMPTSLYYPP